MTMIVVIDMEFVGLPWANEPDLLWVGLADDTGRTFSAINADIDTSELTEWSRNNVWSKVRDDEPRLARHDLATAVRAWIGPSVDQWWAWMPTVEQLASLGAPGDPHEWWERAADWDFQLLRQLIVPWPETWATSCHDLQRFAADAGIDLPPNDNPASSGLRRRVGLASVRTGRLCHAVTRIFRPIHRTGCLSLLAAALCDVSE